MFVSTGEYIVRVMCILVGILLGLMISLVKELFSKKENKEHLVHAHWIGITDGAELQLACSHCHYDYIEADPDCTERHNYCPNCGTKMDEEVFTNGKS